MRVSDGSSRGELLLSERVLTFGRFRYKKVSASRNGVCCTGIYWII